MDLSGNPIRLYPSDPPAAVGFERPGDKGIRGPVGIKRVRWFNPTDDRIPAGSVAHLKDADDRDVFRAVWPDDDGAVNDIVFEVGHVYRGLYLTVLDAGQLEVYID
jgi:hypothetical protein